MRDIKTNKIQKVSKVTNSETGKNVSSKITFESKVESFNAEKSESFVFSKILLFTLVSSIFMYLFFVTSTIYLAVNTQKYVYNIENLNNISSEIVALNPEDNSAFTTKKDRISFINKNSDTAISLK